MKDNYLLSMDKIDKNFLPDDFDRIYQKYFKKLKETNTLKLDPSGWLNTFSKAAENYHFKQEIYNKPIVPYYSDYNDQLSDYKESIAKLLNRWDNHQYSQDNFTLCSSVTLGSMVVLSALFKRNISTIFFETPAFYASISQAKSLGMKFKLIPTYFGDNFSLNLDLQDIRQNAPFILWLTQPRMSLGINQDSISIQNLYKQIPENCFIVIDEASEQLFPSQLCDITSDKYPRIIKIRNFYKGLGINGIRLSFIAHDASLREDIQRELENIQGAIDYFSLVNTLNFSNEIDKFIMMLKIANEQTSSLRISLQKEYQSELLVPSALVNGYVGSVSVDFSKFSSGYRKNREDLLKYCFENGISIILGATMKFAYDEKREFIRINYFKSQYEIATALQIISTYLK